MSNLLIEQLTEEYSGSDDMNKVASELAVLDQSRTLVACAEELFKVACEIENEGLMALAGDTYEMGLRMGAGLSKIASEESFLEEALEMSEDMNKIASVWAEIGDETQDEDFCKLAEAIIEIANEMTSDAEEVLAKLAAEEGEKKTWGRRLKGAGRGVGRAFTAADIRDIFKNAPEGSKLKKGLKDLFASKRGYAALGKTLGAYGTVAGAAYGAKKLYDRKKNR